MKNIIILLAFGLTLSVTGQSRWGVRTGLNYDLNAIGLDAASSSTQDIFEGEALDNGYHIGVFGRQYLGDQLYTSGSLFYAENTHFLEGNDGNNDLFFERFDHRFLQLDAGLGIRLLKFARAEGGVHYQGSISNNAFSNTFATPTAGYNASLGIDLWKISLDVTYYGSFTDHLGTWNDIPLSYERSQILVSIGVEL